LTNLAEYYLGQDPRSSRRPDGWLVATTDTIDGALIPTLEIRRATHILDVDLTIESSTDGRTWAAAPANPIAPPVDHGDGTESIRVRHPAPLTPQAPTSLLRLRFSLRQ